MINFLFLLFLFIFSFTPLCCQRLIKETVKETKQSLSFPFKMSKNGLYLTGVIGGAAFIYVFDENIRNASQKMHSSFNDNFFKIAKKFGDKEIDLAILGGSYLFGVFKDDEYLKETSYLAAKAFFVSNAVITFMKVSFGRTRPYYAEDKDMFKPLNLKDAFNSFPSGHCVSAFSLATVFALRSKTTYTKVFFYSLATAVALERIYSDKHWASDVFIGSTIAYLISRKIVMENENKNKADFSFNFSPNTINLNYSF